MDKKENILSNIISILILSVVFFLFINHLEQKHKEIKDKKNNISKKEDVDIQKKYLKYFDGKTSKIEIQCFKNDDCKIDERIVSLCGIPKPINIHNTEKNIKKYVEKEDKITQTINIKCAILENFSDETFCNPKTKTCELKKKPEN